MYNSSTQQSLTASLLEQKLLSNHMAACFISLSGEAKLELASVSPEGFTDLPP